MQDNPSHFSSHFPPVIEQPPAPSGVPTDERERPRRRRRTDWRLGGRAVSRWNGQTLAIAVLGGVGATLASLAVARLVTGVPQILASIVLWVGLLAVVIAALIKARPAGLFRFAPRDLLWGIGLGTALRMIQGIISGSDGVPFPSSPLLTQGRPAEWILQEVIGSGLVGPLVEEFFFRVVLLVALYQALRRSVGSVAAALTATLVTTGAFVWLHASYGALSLSDGVQLFLLGACFSLAVMLTGRVWSAVIAHVVYNGSFLMLVIAGSQLSA